jgi:pimeloyl-ACP methyl ester carboxylesterase
MQAKLHDPNYLGAISVAPAADLKSILMGMGKPGSSAAYYLGYMAYAMHVRTPSFKPSDMLTGEALKRYADVTTKGCWNYAYAAFINPPIEPMLKPGWDRLPAATRFFQEGEVARAPVAGPLLVIAGEADESVPFEPLRAVAERACSNGSALTFRSYPGLDHDPTMDQSTADQLAWVRDRLAGNPSASNCTSLVK